MPIMYVRGGDGRYRPHEIPDEPGVAPTPVPTARTFLAGLDIGQRDDWTAFAIVEQGADKVLTLVALERVRRVPYPEVARLVADTVGELPGVRLLVDCTGVGRPVTDQLVELGVRHVRVSIHGGSTVGRLDDNTLTVPKRDLVAALAVGFESGRLKLARGLKHAPTLEREAAAFKTKISASGHDSYTARDGEHDDLLLAVALPVWYAWRPGLKAYVG